jgi:hypothetical protein
MSNSVIGLLVSGKCDETWSSVVLHCHRGAREQKGTNQIIIAYSFLLLSFLFFLLYFRNNVIWFRFHEAGSQQSGTF